MWVKGCWNILKLFIFNIKGSPSLIRSIRHHLPFYNKEALFRCLQLAPTLVELSKENAKVDSIYAYTKLGILWPFIGLHTRS